MDDGKHETLAGTVGEHANDDHDHPGRKTPAGAQVDQTATRSPGKTGEDGAIAGDAAPGQGRAGEADGHARVVNLDRDEAKDGDPAHVGDRNR